MGKKRVATKTQDELLKERERVESKLRKEIKKAPQKVKEGRLYISSTYNNTLLSLTDAQGNVLYWTSAGSIGFKGTKKGTPFASSKAAEAMVSAMEKIGIKRVAVFVKGIGAGRESAIRSIATRDIDISSITDITPIPHNGCRPRKPRRV